MTTLVPKRGAARKIGVNERSVDRYTDDPNYAHLNFPKPTEINGRRFWVEDEIERWIQERIRVRQYRRGASPENMPVEAAS